MKYKFDWVDAFTTEPFGGNGCAVVYDADDISIDQRLALVRETNLSECAFLVSTDKADFGVRYYLADQEILMAGHPTIATIHSLLHRGLIAHDGTKTNLTLEVGAGVLPIEITGADEPLITMTQAAPMFGARSTAADIAAIYGLRPDDIIGVPQIVSTGTAFCIAVVGSKGALDAAVLDVSHLQRWQQTQTGTARNSIPFLVTLGGATDAGDTFSRLLLAPPSPPEDPFTGSATGCMAAYLWAEGLLENPKFIAEQGHGMGRPGQAAIEVLGPRADITGVKVAGKGVVLMQGDLVL